MDPLDIDEKASISQKSDVEDSEVDFDVEAAERRLVRKIDFCIVPLVTLLFLLNFIDRSAVGNANVAGLSTDLRLSASKYQYNIALSLFYILYIIVEIPSNLILNRIGSSWISCLVVMFGVITISNAFVHDYHQFLALRALLGVAEGGTLPGIAFLLSKFYKRHELVFRIGIFLSVGTSLAGAFGGLIASGLVQNTELGSVRSWRKIFLVEGLITTAVGLLSFIVMPTNPANAKFLRTARERELAVSRLQSEYGDTDKAQKATDWRLIKRGFFNIHAWSCGLGYTCINIPVQGTSLFLPTIIKSLGHYSTVKIQLLSVPPYVVSTVWTIGVCYACSRTRLHGIFIAGSLILSVIGYAMFMASDNPHIRYGACFLTFSGVVPCGPIWLAWVTGNTAPATPRAVASAIVPTLGTVGAVAATWAYLPSTAPEYRPGTILNLCASCLGIVIALGNVFYLRWENRQRDLGRRDHRLDGLVDHDIRKIGSYHPRWRYIL